MTSRPACRAAIALALALGAVAGEPLGGWPRPWAAEPAVEALEQAVADRVNGIRRDQGRAPLRVDGALAAVAREYSCGLARRGTLSHAGPEGGTVADRVRAAGKRFAAVGENLASNTNVRDPVATAVEGWMRSPGHRDNILEPSFTETGVGVCRAGDSVYVTQVFLRPAGAR
jgi:uncharacterized protein YkwD